MYMQGPVLLSCLFILSILELAACSKMSIVGGKEVKAHSKPWMVSIQVKESHVCGGTLIKDQWVLTAAHCKSVFGSMESVTVLLGAHSLSKHKGNQRVGIKNWHIPKTFNMKTKADDIMLMQLKREVKNGKTVKVKNIPKSGKDVQSGSRCLVIGWGITEVKVLSDRLQGVEVMVLDRDLCNCYYNSNPVITEDMLCATNKEKRGDACQGDSGGPLEYKKDIVGLVSGGLGCGDPKKPGVYTLLSKRHLSWISKVVKGQFNTTTR